MHVDMDRSWDISLGISFDCNNSVVVRVSLKEDGYIYIDIFNLPSGSNILVSDNYVIIMLWPRDGKYFTGGLVANYICNVPGIRDPLSPTEVD